MDRKTKWLYFWIGVLTLMVFAQSAFMWAAWPESAEPQKVEAGIEVKWEIPVTNTVGEIPVTNTVGEIPVTNTVGEIPQEGKELTYRQEDEGKTIEEYKRDLLAEEMIYHGSIMVGCIVIHANGEANYPSDISEHAKAFWDTLALVYPEMEWCPVPNKWYHVSYKSNVGQPVVLDVEFPSSEAMQDWLKSIGATGWRISKVGGI